MRRLWLIPCLIIASTSTAAAGRVEDLHAALTTAGIPVAGVSVAVVPPLTCAAAGPSDVRIDFGAGATAPQRAQAYATACAWDWTASLNVETASRSNLKGTVGPLRQWASDARSAVAAWDGQTQAQKNATLKVLLDRLGTLLDRTADVIQAEGLN